jgi:tetratricopeptide (TPR) repeat protein
MAPNSMKYNPAFLDDDRLIESFVARNAELETILEVLRENTAGSNQHLLIIGPRGIGKTTLVLRSAAEIRTEATLGAQWHPVVFGEETYQVSSPGEFWLEALFHLGEQTGDSRWQKAYEELLLERDEGRLRARVLAQLMDFADEQKKRLVLVVENLNMLVGDQVSGDDAWALRHTLMNEPRLMLLGTATSRFKEVEEYDQALYDLFRTIELEPLEDAEVQALWTSTTGQGATARQIRPLQILTGGNPRLIRILSEFAANTSFRSLMDDLTRLVDEHTEYFKHHLDNLPPQERKVFVALTDLWDPSTARKVAEAARLDVNTASAMLKRLIGRGAVTMAYKRGKAQYYQVAERMYNIYHLMRRRGPAASRVHAVVRFMVSLYRDEELVRTTRSLVEEASRLNSDQRREHFLAYEAILTHTREPRLTKRLVEATRFAFEGMPDIPLSLQKLIGLQRSGEAGHDFNLLADTNALMQLRVENVEDANTLLLLGDFLSEQANRLEDAEAAFRKAIQQDPHNADTWISLGVFLGGKLERDEDALGSFDRALALDSERPVVWVNRGTALLALGRFQEAHESFDRALDLKSDNVAAWLGKSGALYEMSRFEEALQSADRALALNPDDATTWFSRGRSLNELKRYEEALASFDRALSFEPDNIIVWLERGGVLYEVGRFEAALQSADRALALDPDDATTWYNRGLALSRLGRDDDASDSLERSLALDPRFAPAWLQLSLVLSHIGNHEKALESANRVLLLESDNVPAWTMKGRELVFFGRFEEASDACNRALELDPENVLAWNTKGWVFDGLGRSEDALAAYNRALELDPESMSVLLSRGLANRRLKRFEEAVDDLRQAFALGAGIYTVTNLVELLLQNLHLPEEALAAARDYIERAGDSAEALNALAWEFFKNGPKESFGEVESWARRAVELVTGSGFYRHTLASLLGAQGKWEGALEQASIFLSDKEMLTKALDEVIDFFIDAVAIGHDRVVLNIIETSASAEIFEPLIVAIQQRTGAQIDVAREILEVAKDVTKRIDARRDELRGGRISARRRTP